MLLWSRAIEAPHGFTTRAGGVSQGPFASLNLGRGVGDDVARVEENERILAVAAGLGGARLAWVHQVHGDGLVEVGAGPVPKGGWGHADGLLTRERGVALGVRTADCVPVLIHAPRAGAIAAVHAGWRGTHLAIAARAVERLAGAFGARPAEFRAAIGPSIRRCCYEVGEEVARLFEARFGSAVVERREGGIRLDLAEANRRVLVEAGVPAEGIDVLPHCTACDPERFFSHRRDRGRTGRHLAFIALTSTAGEGGPIS